MKIEVDSAQVRLPPPFALLGVIIAGFLFRSVLPFPFLSEALRWTVGGVLFSAGAYLMLRAVFLFRKHKTNVPPWMPSLVIIKEGPYRFSRNPIYLAFLLIASGCACLANNLWAFVGVGALFLFLRFYVIAKEEAYLTSKFGEEYLSYQRSRRRWF